jgi:hypothetical protein
MDLITGGSVTNDGVVHEDSNNLQASYTLHRDKMLIKSYLKYSIVVSLCSFCLLE